METLFATANFLEGRDDSDRVTRNAFLESFLVHLRNLFACFYPETFEENADSIQAVDFFCSSSTWDDGRPALSEALAETQARLNRRVAHLSFSRLTVTANDLEWDYDYLAHQVEAVWETFRSLLRAERDDRELELPERVSRAAGLDLATPSHYVPTYWDQATQHFVVNIDLNGATVRARAGDTTSVFIAPPVSGVDMD